MSLEKFSVIDSTLREGEQFVNGYSEEYFEKFMQYSEQVLNNFLDAKNY